jgi:hypothetical protein
MGNSKPAVVEAVARMVTLTAVADDTRYQNSNGEEPSQAIAAAEYYVDVPPWNGGIAAGMEVSDNGSDPAVRNVEATIDTTGWKNGKHIVFVRAQDQDGNWGAVSAVFMHVYGS